MKYILLIFTVLSLERVHSQVTQKYASEYEGFYRAEELYAKKEFSSAKFEFESFLSACKNSNDPFYVKAQYYVALSALSLNHDDEAIRLFVRFNKDYPENIYKNDIYFKLGNYYFSKQNKKGTKLWFEKVIVADLNETEKDEYYFKYGYNFHLLNENIKAKTSFISSKENKTKFGFASKFYFGIICFAEDSTSMEAYKSFNSLKDDGQYLDQVYNYLVQIKHNLKNYQECTDKYSSKEVIEKLSYDNRYLIGNAYYQQKEYQKAIPFYEEYDSVLRVQKNRTSDRDFNYAFGNALYKIGNLKKAIEKFNLVLTKRDSLSQIVYYQIADIFKQEYEKTRDVAKLINARTAFEKASEISFNPSLQEDALYNAAVIAFNVDDSPYNQSIQIFEKFLKLFSNSERKNQIYQFLVEVYRRTDNYDLALSTIENISLKDTKLKMIYQSIAYNYGVTLFLNSNYKGAIEKFNLVEKYPEDVRLKSLSKFWIAESCLRQFESKSSKSVKDSLLLDDAMEAFRSFIKDPSGSTAEKRHEAYYQMGYILLRQKNFIDAIETLRIFVSSGTKDTKKLVDANLRIGDSYYVMRKDEDAIKFYKNALDLNSGSEDIALYYMSKSHGFLEENDKKIELLNKLISNYKKSSFLQWALYDLALAYKDEKADYTSALLYFNRILKEFPSVTFHLDCQIEVADIFFLRNEYDKAEAEYQRILDANINNNSICLKAATGLKNVFSAKGEVDKIVGLVNKYPCAQISSDEIENLYFAPAEKSYTDSLFSAAIPQFEMYLSKFSKGRYTTEVLYYLGDCYARSGNNQKKIELYKQLLSLPVSPYTETAAAFISQQAYNSGEYDQAIIYYLQLEKVSTKPTSVYSARLGLMRSSFLLQKYDTAAIYSELLLESGNLSNSIKVEVEYSKGISNFKMLNYEKALPSLSWISKNTTTSWASEAQYVIAEIYFIKNDYTQADIEARVLLKMKPGYNFWIAKTLILQSRVCLRQNNLFQAEETINSVLNHYPEKDDGIIDEANSVNQEIEQLKNGGNENE
ncbi:MAG: tetratricopeptide repeat protein [Bacteroidetes bacterium]|nr:tetratricopeptide repeat protein [Bacteroidota bacterium]